MARSRGRSTVSVEGRRIVKAMWNGAVLAESDETVVVEGGRGQALTRRAMEWGRCGGGSGLACGSGPPACLFSEGAALIRGGAREGRQSIARRVNAWGETATP